MLMIVIMLMAMSVIVVVVVMIVPLTRAMAVGHAFSATVAHTCLLGWMPGFLANLFGQHISPTPGACQTPGRARP